MYDFFFQNTNRMVIKIWRFPKIGRGVSGDFTSSELQKYPGKHAPGPI